MSAAILNRLSARDRKVLLFGAGICATLIVATRGVPAALRWSAEERANGAQLVIEEARARESVARSRDTRDSLKARGARYYALGQSLLEGESVAGGGGSLASLLSDAAGEANVRLGSVQVRADTAGAGAFTTIGVRATATGDLRGIAALLRTLERGPTLLAVRELSITQPEPAAGDDRPEALQVQLLVEGLMLTPRAEGGR